MRRAKAADRTALHALYATSFPEEDLTELLDALARCPEGTQFVAGAAEGHVAVTSCAVDGTPVALLGPIAVAPERQSAGLGRRLVEAAIAAARTDAAAICVLGDPAFYARLGFAREDAVRPPYPLKPEWDGAWQSVRFGAVPEGVLDVPEPWRDRMLWA